MDGAWGDCHSCARLPPLRANPSLPGHATQILPVHGAHLHPSLQIRHGMREPGHTLALALRGPVPCPSQPEYTPSSELSFASLPHTPQLGLIQRLRGFLRSRVPDFDWRRAA